jgi:hypothetical protein
MEMCFDAVYYCFVFINVFNTLRQEHLHTALFYCLLVLPKATIALFSLACSEDIHGSVMQISHKSMHPVEV